jgi:hypothetical protein
MIHSHRQLWVKALGLTFINSMDFLGQICRCLQKAGFWNKLRKISMRGTQESSILPVTIKKKDHPMKKIAVFPDQARWPAGL